MATIEYSREAILEELNEFDTEKTTEISPTLEYYLQRVAKSGDTMFPWCQIKPLFRKKLELVLTEFHDSCPTETITPVPNVDTFKYEPMRNKLFLSIDSFHKAPFTIQRLSELLTNPKQHYKRTDKFMRGLEKNIMVVSTVEPKSFLALDAMDAMDANHCSSPNLLNGMANSPINGNAPLDTFASVFASGDGDEEKTSTEESITASPRVKRSYSEMVTEEEDEELSDNMPTPFRTEKSPRLEDFSPPSETSMVTDSESLEVPLVIDSEKPTSSMIADSDLHISPMIIESELLNASIEEDSDTIDSPILDESILLKASIGEETELLNNSSMTEEAELLKPSLLEDSEPLNPSLLEETCPLNPSLLDGSELLNPAIETESEPHSSSMLTESEPHSSTMLSVAEPHSSSMMTEAEPHSSTMLSEAEPHSSSMLVSEAEPHSSSMITESEPHSSSMLAESEPHSSSMLAESEPHSSSMLAESDSLKSPPSESMDLKLECHETLDINEPCSSQTLPDVILSHSQLEDKENLAPIDPLPVQDPDVLSSTTTSDEEANETALSSLEPEPTTSDTLLIAPQEELEVEEPTLNPTTAEIVEPKEEEKEEKRDENKAEVESTETENSSPMEQE